MATKVKAVNSMHPSPVVVRVFARRLRDWRREAGLPLKHIARDLGVSVSIVSEWEHGHRFPGIVNLEALAGYMGLHVCCLLFHGHGHCPHLMSKSRSGAAKCKPVRGGR